MPVRFEMCCFHAALSQLSKPRHEWSRVKEHLPFRMFQNRHLEGPKLNAAHLKRLFAFTEMSVDRKGNLA